MRAAASLVLIANQGHGKKVLMIKRHAKARAMANLYAFPGGILDAADGNPNCPKLEAHKNCALRELFEETGCVLSGEGIASVGSAPTFDAVDDLHPFSHWISPTAEKYRYDTWFFAHHVQNGDDAINLALKADEREISDISWICPKEAIDRHNSNLDKVFRLPPPTFVILDYMSKFENAHQIINAVDCYRYEPRVSVPAVEPIRFGDGHNVEKIYIGSNKVHIPDGVHKLRMFDSDATVYIGDEFLPPA